MLLLALKMITPAQLQRYKYLLFDYDSTIARVPLDWPQARDDFRTYLSREFPSLMIPEIARVDEMEAIALKCSPKAKSKVFSFRFDLESKLDGSHEPIAETCQLIEELSENASMRLFVVSNNLHRTVDVGLQQLGLRQYFMRILGVDDVGVPKPATRAFEILREEAGCLEKDCGFIGDNTRTDGGFCRALNIDFYNITERP